MNFIQFMIYYNKNKREIFMNINKWISKNAELIKNKNIVITGTTSGLGFEAMKHLALAFANVVVGVRNTERANSQIENLKKECPNAFIVAVKLDLTDPKSIKQFSVEVNKIFADGIDALINNAGIYAQKQKILETGFEQHFFVNCIAPCYLSKLLLPALEKRKNSKLVFVSSISIKGKIPNFDNIDKRDEHGDIKIYGNSKIWLTLYALELKNKLAKNNSNVCVNICQPGIAATSLMHYSHGKFSKFAFKFINFGMNLLFPKTKKACLVEIYSIFSKTNQNEWVCPAGISNVYGYPKTKKLKLKKQVLACAPKCFEIISNEISKF